MPRSFLITNKRYKSDEPTPTPAPPVAAGDTATPPPALLHEEDARDGVGDNAIDVTSFNAAASVHVHGKKSLILTVETSPTYELVLAKTVKTLRMFSSLGPPCPASWAIILWLQKIKGASVHKI